MTLGPPLLKTGCSGLCQGWRFEFIFESRFALIGPLVILQGSDPAL